MLIIKSSNLRFKNPEVGKPTRAVEEHFNGRRVVYDLDGIERTIKLSAEEVGFRGTEEDIEDAIELKIKNEG